MQWLAIFIGAGFGACLRAWLAKFNGHLSSSSAWSWLPLGTLLANILGGLLMGLAIVLFQHFSQSLNPHLKVMIGTGFLGGLTTFSTFSAEVLTLLNSGKLALAFSLIFLHVFITLIATAIGFYSLRFVLYF